MSSSAPGRPLPDAAVATATAALIVEELARSGVSQCFVAPGSRSTPLVVAFARHPRIRVDVVIDERVAAFATLGWGRATRKPAVMLTTSGTAIGHALPAVLEAEADGVPMLLFSADRAPEARATGANQTIDQVQLFGHHVRVFHDLPCPSSALPPAWWLSTIDDVVASARGASGLGLPGPVHCNFMFRKPLEPVAGALAELLPLVWPDAARHSTVQRWLAGAACWARVEAAVIALSSRGAAALRDALEQAGGDGLVVIGGLHDDDERAAARRVAAILGWPVLADVTSGLRLDATTPGLCPTLELTVAAPAMAGWLRPAMVLELGGHVVSTRVAAWLDQQAGRRVAVRSEPQRRDAEHGQTLRLRGSVASLAATLERLAADGDLPSPSPRLSVLQALEAANAPLLREALDGDGAIEDEMAVARAVVASLPPGSALWIASSMPIRDVDSYAAPRDDAPIVLANRGASGIDGLVAAAAGAALGRGGRVVALIGDLAALHDVGGLVALASHDWPVTVVCVDNRGGGIFHFLPIAGHDDVFETCFAAAHDTDLVALGRGMGLDVVEVASRAALRDEVSRSGQGGKRARLVVVRTERNANRRAHAALLARVHAQVEDWAVGHAVAAP